MSKTHRIAIIGVGAIAGMHGKAIGDLPNAELVAGCCRSEDKGRRFAREFGVKWYGDYESMLDEQKPDLVTIATPSGAHLEPTLACARCGIDVLCEKPLEITTERVDRMIRAAGDSGIRLGGIFPQRFNPVVVTLHEAAAQGRFGALAAVNTYVPWWRDEAYYAPQRWQGKLKLDGGGAIMNQSVHGIDAIQWIAGSADADAEANPVESVFAFIAKRGHDKDLIEVEDTGVAVLRFHNGALGQILGATSMYPGSLKRIQIAGRDGTAEVLEDELITWEFRNPCKEDEVVRTRFGAATQSGGGASDPMAIDYSNHTRNIAAFLESVEHSQSFMLDGTEARKAVAIVEAIYKSAATGAAVTVA